MNLPIRLCRECHRPIFFGEYFISQVSGVMHRRCATKLKMRLIRKQQIGHTVDGIIDRALFIAAANQEASHEK